MLVEKRRKGHFQGLGNVISNSDSGTLGRLFELRVKDLKKICAVYRSNKERDALPEEAEIRFSEDEISSVPICCFSRSADVAMQMRSVQEIFQFLCKSLVNYIVLRLCFYFLLKLNGAVISHD